LGNVRDDQRSKKDPSSSSPSESDERAQASKSESNFFASAIPSSLTSFLLNILDSPAYANLTTRFLNDEFNPSTPNVDGVKYFSVAGRLPSVSVWHPFWLPKMVLDGVEEREREAMRNKWLESFGSSWQQEPQQHQRPLWAKEDEWGNDGLVTVQSAKWGEFLGIMEGCDRKYISFLSFMRLG
jgi:triacylglycerol lipase